MLGPRCLYGVAAMNIDTMLYNQSFVGQKNMVRLLRQCCRANFVTWPS